LLPVGLSENSGGKIRSSPLLTSFHHGSPCSYITWGMNNRPIGRHSSDIVSPHQHNNHHQILLHTFLQNTT
jgi:hypothetical protein